MGTKAFVVSRFRKKLSPANWMQGVTAISRKKSRSRAPRLQNSRNRWAKKWGPTCDRIISNSAIYTTAIYREYTVSGQLSSDHIISTAWSSDKSTCSPMPHCTRRVGSANIQTLTSYRQGDSQLLSLFCWCPGRNQAFKPCFKLDPQSWT